MQPRLNPYPLATEPMKLMMAMEAYLSSRLPADLIHLVKLRASQLNGCAFCIEMHTRESLRDGLLPAKLLLLSAWQESSAFSARERAALRWTEALTELSRTRAPDGAWEAVCGAFSEQEVVDLTCLINQINSWNRIAVGFRSQHPALSAG